MLSFSVYLKLRCICTVFLICCKQFDYCHELRSWYSAQKPQGQENIFQFTFYLAQIINYSEKVSRWIFLHKSSLFLYIHILFVSSPSQGPCCTAHCTFKLKTDKCRNDSDCAREGMCNGLSALCPASEPKPNFTDCNRRTQVCLNGVCFCLFTIICNCSCLLQGAKHCALQWYRFNI